ncbi:hypothetical protein GCM10023339_47570 [Alloalcanivorax gelatiniphagus]
MFRRGSYANVASTLALIVALGGTSYAAIAIPKDSVGSKQIINSSVKSADVKNGSLQGADFKPGELPAGKQGPAGPAGPAGAAGPAGPAGTARAFARVSGGATPVLNTAKGFTGVTHVATGVYCIALPGFDASTTSWFATVDWLSTADPEGNATAMVRRTGCPGGTVGVYTERIDPATGVAAAADNVAFHVLVP